MIARDGVYLLRAVGGHIHFVVGGECVEVGIGLTPSEARQLATKLCNMARMAESNFEKKGQTNVC